MVANRVRKKPPLPLPSRRRRRPQSRGRGRKIRRTSRNWRRRGRSAPTRPPGAHLRRGLERRRTPNPVGPAGTRRRGPRRRTTRTARHRRGRGTSRHSATSRRPQPLELPPRKATIVFVYGSATSRLSGEIVAIFSGGTLLLEPRVRVSGSHCREGRQQGADEVALRCRRAPRVGGEHALEQRIDVDRDRARRPSAPRRRSCRSSPHTASGSTGSRMTSPAGSSGRVAGLSRPDRIASAPTMSVAPRCPAAISLAARSISACGVLPPTLVVSRATSSPSA